MHDSTTHLIVDLYVILVEPTDVVLLDLLHDRLKEMERVAFASDILVDSLDGIDHCPLVVGLEASWTQLGVDLPHNLEEALVCSLVLSWQ